MTTAEKIVSKMNVLAFNSNELNESGDFYPTEQDYIETIGYALIHGWVASPTVFTSEEMEFIKALI
jgi:hypothetical protein